MPNKISALDYDTQSKTLKPVEISFSKSAVSPTSFGETVTTKACREMIKNKFEAEIADLPANADKVYAVEFGREAILEILSQEGCEAIRFAFCKLDKGEGFLEDSIVAIGIKSNQRPIKEEYFTENFAGNFLIDPPMVKERGNGKRLSEFVQELSGASLDVNSINLTDKLFKFI